MGCNGTENPPALPLWDGKIVPSSLVSNNKVMGLILEHHSPEKTFVRLAVIVCSVKKPLLMVTGLLLPLLCTFVLAVPTSWDVFPLSHSASRLLRYYSFVAVNIHLYLSKAILAVGRRQVF